MRWIIVVLLAVGCDRTAPASSPPSSAPVPAAAPSAHPTAEPGPGGATWDFLGPPDAAAAEATRQRQATLARYLQAESEDGELHVDDGDVEALIELAGPLLQEQVGKATRAALEADGQRFVRAAWLAEHGRAAAAGSASLVRIPLQLCIGWGCDVPSDYVAADCFGPAVVFIEPIDPTGVLAECNGCVGLDDDDARLTCIESACELVVDGHFTGKTHAASEPTECGEAWEFEVRGRAPAGAVPYDLVVAAGEPPP